MVEEGLNTLRKAFADFRLAKKRDNCPLVTLRVSKAEIITRRREKKRMKISSSTKIVSRGMKSHGIDGRRSGGRAGRRMCYHNSPATGSAYVTKTRPRRQCHPAIMNRSEGNASVFFS